MFSLVVGFCKMRILHALILVPLLAACNRPDPGERSALGDATPTYRAQVLNPDYAGGIVEPKTGAFLVWGSDGTILRSDDGLQWIHTKTPTFQTINRIAADNAGVLVAVGTAGTILRSEDGGRIWMATSSNSTNVDLKSVVHHGPSGAWLAAGTKGTLLRSEDGARTWFPLNSNVSLTIEALFVEPKMHIVFLGGETGLIGSSKDGGQQWLLSQMPIETPVTGFHAHGDVVVGTSAVGRIMSTSTFGEFWHVEQMPSKSFWTDTAFDPRHKVIVVTGHTGDILRSQNGGKTWKVINVAPKGEAKYLSSVSYDEKSQALVAIGHYGTVLKSTDGGKKWSSVGNTGDNTARSTPAPNGDHIDAVIHDTKRNIFVGVGKKGLLRLSTDAWQTSTSLSQPVDAYFREAIVSADKSTVIATGGIGSIARSTNDGKSWRVVDGKYPDPSTPPTLRAVIVDPQTQALIAAGPTGMIIRSADAGKTWKTVYHTPFEENEAFTQILVDKRTNTLVVIEVQGRMVFSQDGGNNWKPAPIKAKGDFWHGAVLKNKPLMIVTGSKGVLARSQDAGVTWELVNSGVTVNLYGAYADDHNNALFVMGDGGVILRSEDGKQWQAHASGTTQTLRRMITEPKSGALIAFGQGGTLLRSDDGKSWQALNSSVKGELRTALIEPGSRNVVVLGQGGAVIRSDDEGHTWHQLFSQTSKSFRSGVFHPSTGSLVAVGERIVRFERQRTESK